MDTPSLSELGGFLDTHRQTLLTVLTVVELAILLVLLLRWVNRRYGLRHLGRRLRRGITDTARGLVAPIVGRLRARRGMRVVAARFAGPGPVPTARAGIMSAGAALGGQDECWPYLVLLGDQEVGVRVAGPGSTALRPSAESGWQVSGHLWRTRRPLPPTSGAVSGAPLPVAVGVRARDLVLLDLGRCPGVVSVHGAPGAVDRLVCAMTVQVAALIGGHGVDRLIVAVPPDDDLATADLERQGLPEALTLLATDRAAAVGRRVLVCRRPDAATAARLAALVADDPTLLVLVAGYLPGSRWRLRVDTDGRVSAPELALDAESAPLVRITRSRRRPTAPTTSPTWAEEDSPAATPVSAVSSAPAAPTAGVDTPPPPPPTPTPTPTGNDDLIEQTPETHRPMAHSSAEPAGRPGDR
ncbi:hypothetical protein [Micromonospora sp. NPDC003241]